MSGPDLDTLRGALRDRAEADVDAARLLGRIGPAYRRRRKYRVGGTAAALAVAAVLAAVVPRVVPGLDAPPVGPAAPVGGAVGSDPWTTHFDVGEFPGPAQATIWAVRDGTEELTLLGGDFSADLVLTPDPAATAAAPPQAVNDPAGPEPDALWVYWPPADGVRAVLKVTGPATKAQVLAFAGTVRLGGGHRCNPRVRPTALPDGARVTGCEVREGIRSGSLTIAGAKGKLLVSVSAQPQPAAAPGDLHRLANGWQYTVAQDPAATATIRVVEPSLEIVAQGSYGLPDVLQLAGHLQLVP